MSSSKFGRPPPHHDATRPSTSPAKTSLKCNAPTLKSKRNGELGSSQLKRRRITSNHAIAPSSVSLSQSPEPSSINDILRSHSRERLYVPPLQWTAHHLDLLGCRFVRNKTPRPTVEGHRADLPAQTALGLLANRLLCPSITEFKTTVIRLHLEDHNIIYRRSDLLFSFGSRPVVNLTTDGVFSLSRTDSAAPVMAYLDIEAVRSRRNTSIKVSGGNRPNPPIARLRQKIQRRLNPIKEAEDPYIAAVLIALAQAVTRDSPVPAASQDEEVTPEATTRIKVRG
ncbi:hypothetical protein B0T21DRAFT_134619 [Apiosordaria backusii]|uniref:Uncharacterized protein n=1 Tax=Apiosordaria backusii TaxID=314023 RepID=A0AA39ZPL5_9PEZI|nr:hypothetical protein B0T21DRAFT_134619 [Apiosordaria backusii]